MNEFEKRLAEIERRLNELELDVSELLSILVEAGRESEKIYRQDRRTSGNKSYCVGMKIWEEEDGI